MRSGIEQHVREILRRHELADHTTLMLYDEVDSISTYHSNAVYEAASAGESTKPILLIIHSNGGGIEPAYLISKTCKKLANACFKVAVPRRAKSAATLICLGADEIHMGQMSELGPIDPQIGGYPALGLRNALEVLTKIVSEHPKASPMFADYMAQKLELKDLGYSDRVGESAVQYAERLLGKKKFPTGKTANSLASHFVNHYKDHGFVIDIDEARGLLGESIVRDSTREYRAANDIFVFLNNVKIALDIFRDEKFWYVGSVEGGFLTRRNPKTN